MQWNWYKVVLLIFITQTVKVNNHKGHMKDIAFLIAAQALGFSKLLPTRIAKCIYKRLNLSSHLNKQFDVVLKTVPVLDNANQQNFSGFNNR